MLESSLKKTEYLKAFDIYTDNVAEIISYTDLYGSEAVPLISEKNIVGYRQTAMLNGYRKYGPVNENYIRYKLMKPIANLLIRLDKYKQTKNTAYLIDVLNFAMLTYWTYTNIPESIKDVQGIKAWVQRDILEGNTNVDRIEQLTDLFDDQVDLAYLGLLALFAKREIQYPQTSATYSTTDKCVVAGTCIREILEGVYDD